MIHGSGSTIQAKQGKTRVFQDRTNIPIVSLVPHPKQVDFPLHFVSPIAVEMQHVVNTESRHKEDTAIRRSNRYTQAEQALTYSFQRSLQQELPTSQLQIDVLRKAISLLQFRISETGHSLEKLRTVLADRSLEPQEYQCIQRQRWLEERRLLSAEEFAKALQRSLKTIPPSSQPQTISSVSSNAKPKGNLLGFLQYPGPRALINKQHYRRRLRNDNAVARNAFPRVHRHTSLLTLTLPTQPRRPLRTTLLTLPPLRTPLFSDFETSEAAHSSPSLTSLSLSNSASTCEAIPLPEPMPLLPTTSLLLPPSTDATGTATIWQNTMSFSREEILRDLVVSIPDYVNDLMAEFDSAIPAGPPPPLEKLLMTNKIASIDIFQSQMEKSSMSSATDCSSIPRQQATTPSPPKRRHSVLFDVVSSHMGSKSGDGQMSSRAARRRSSPPSAFPSSLPRASTALNEPTGRSSTRRTSISISDLRSVFSGSASSNGPIATSTPRNSESAHSPHQPEQLQRNSTDEKLLTRLRRRMSFLRRF